MIFISMILCCIVFAMASGRKFSLIEPYTIYFISYLYYFFLIPISMTVIGNYTTFVGDTDIFVTSWDMLQLSVINFMGFVAITIAYKLVGSPIRASDLDAGADAKSGTSSHEMIVLTVGLVLAVLALVALFPRELRLLLSGYEAKISTIYASPTFSWLFESIIVIFGVLVNQHILKSRVPIIATVVALIVFIFAGFISSSKGPFVFAFLSAACLFFRFARHRQWLGFILLIGGGAVALLYVVPVLSIFRSTGTVQFFQPSIGRADVIYSDALGPFGVLVLMLGGLKAPPPHSLLLAPFLWVPRGLWHSRPVDIGESFARAVIPGWQPGWGMGFSPAAEAYQRFGLLLSPLFFLLFGLSFFFLQRLFARFVSPEMRLALVVTTCGYLAFIANRGSLAGMLTQSLQLWALLLVLLTFAGVARQIIRNASVVS